MPEQISEWTRTLAFTDLLSVIIYTNNVEYALKALNHIVGNFKKAGIRLIGLKRLTKEPCLDKFKSPDYQFTIKYQLNHILPIEVIERILDTDVNSTHSKKILTEIYVDSFGDVIYLKTDPARIKITQRNQNGY